MFKRYADETRIQDDVNIIKGTAGNDQLVGTPGDDIFLPRTGIDVITGGQGGVDTIKLTYNSAEMRADWTMTENGISGTTSSSDLRLKETFSGIDHIKAHFGEFDSHAVTYKVDAFNPDQTVLLKANYNAGSSLRLVFAESVLDPLVLHLKNYDAHTNVGLFKAFYILDIVGGGGDDVMSTDFVSAKFSGGSGDDVLTGGSGDDVLTGGPGQDLLIGGLKGTSTQPNRDEFHFVTGDTMADAAHADRIDNFSQAEHDTIDLKGYDAIARTAKVNAFTFIGDADFSGKAGELRYEFQDGDTLVSGNTDGDKTADFYIRLTGEITLTAADFVFAPAAAPIHEAFAPATHPDLVPHHLILLA